MQAVEVDIDTEFKESVWVKLNLKGNNKLLFGCVYKSPSSNEANLTALNGLISKVCDMNFSHIVTTGDFNYPDIDWELCTPYNRLSGQQMLSGIQIISMSHGMTSRNFFDVFLPFYLLFGF